MESKPDNPNRIRRLAIEQALKETKLERELLRERLAHIDGEIARLDEEYAALPWTPPHDLDFRRGAKGEMGRPERIYRIVLEGKHEGVTFEEVCRRLPDLPPKWIYNYVNRIVKRGILRKDTIGRVRRIFVVMSETPYEIHKRETGG